MAKTQTTNATVSTQTVAAPTPTVPVDALVLPEITEHHVAFLKHRGYPNHDTIEKVRDFCNCMEEQQTVDGFFADAAAWTAPLIPDEDCLPEHFDELEDGVDEYAVTTEREVAAIVVGGKVRVVPDETTLREMIQVGYPHAHAGQWFEAEVLAIHEHWIDVGLDVKPVGMHQQHVHAARMMKPTRVVMTGVKPYDHRGAGVQFRVYTEV